MGKRNKPYKYDEVKEYVDNLGYELISKNYINAGKKLILKDKDGYYYEIRFGNLINSKKLCKFSKSNSYTIQNIHLWCKLNNKPFILFSDTYIDINKKLKWKCLKDGCEEEFDNSLANVLQMQICPYCASRRVGLLNCLATRFPEVASQWHPTKNGNLTPYNVTSFANKYVWWKCSKNPKHEWYAEISSVVSNCINNKSSSKGCPYCCGRYTSEDYNLLICNPEIASVWDYNKNDKRPEDYTPYSNEYIWWKCKECGHEWNVKINSRSSFNTGCPECSKSKGEKECKRVLIFNNWIEISQEDFKQLIDEEKYNKNYFIPQMKFNGLIGMGNGLLSYDFYIPKLNLLIEYQGNYHDGTVPNQIEEEYEVQIEHDKRKCEYALNNNINLLEIWYWDFDNIEMILNKELNI